MNALQGEGESPRVIKAGEAFWEPGSDVIHYQDGDNRTDIRVCFVATMMCAPGARPDGSIPPAPTI